MIKKLVAALSVITSFSAWNKSKAGGSIIKNGTFGQL